jgi:hypothetical protein
MINKNAQESVMNNTYLSAVVYTKNTMEYCTLKKLKEVFSVADPGSGLFSIPKRTKNGQPKIPSILTQQAKPEGGHM